ncbi:hypothetical protein [Shimia marina]|uniref:Uncharacterized protein n=1 Tax=Shimia marina TaxID=321267 RepID=A0A0P1ERG6_9RHOB|nr:hypothetical protein [Shimia marina]CUH53061.1 hypothetical protein SHM7688_02513 [Shimia marina]SFD93456.1 hypothetical protein SAMN04488037_103312 [Shimia marina]
MIFHRALAATVAVTVSYGSAFATDLATISTANFTQSVKQIRSAFEAQGYQCERLAIMDPDDGKVDETGCAIWKEEFFFSGQDKRQMWNMRYQKDHEMLIVVFDAQPDKDRVLMIGQASFFEEAAVAISSSDFLQDKLSVLSGTTPTFGTFDASEDELDLCLLMTEEAMVLAPADLPDFALEETQSFLGSQVSPAAILCERWMSQERDTVVEFVQSDAGPTYARKIEYYAKDGKAQQYMDMLWDVQAVANWTQGTEHSEGN